MKNNNKEYEFEKEFNAMMSYFYSDQSPNFKALKKSIQSFCKKHFNTIDEVSINNFLKALEALKEKKNFSQEEMAAKVSIFFKSLENAKGKKTEKISLWRRFVNFILSLFRSNPKSSQSHEVVEEKVEVEVEEIAALSVSQEQKIDRLAEALKQAMEEYRLSQIEDSEQEEEEEDAEGTISGLDSSFDSDSVFSFEDESDVTESDAIKLERLLLDKASLSPRAQEIIFAKLALALAGEFPPQLEDSGYEGDTESNDFTEENAQVADATELKCLLADESSLLSAPIKDFIFKNLCSYLSETSEQVVNEAEPITDVPLEALINLLTEIPADIYAEILKQIPEVIYAEIYSEIYDEIQAEYLTAVSEDDSTSGTTEPEKEVTQEDLPEPQVPSEIPPPVPTSEVPNDEQLPIPTLDTAQPEKKDEEESKVIEETVPPVPTSEIPNDEPSYTPTLNVAQPEEIKEEQDESGYESLFKKCTANNKMSENDSPITASMSDTKDTDALADALAAMKIVEKEDLKLEGEPASQVPLETPTLTTSAPKKETDPFINKVMEYANHIFLLRKAKKENDKPGKERVKKLIETKGKEILALLPVAQQAVVGETKLESSHAKEGIDPLLNKAIELASHISVLDRAQKGNDRATIKKIERLIKTKGKELLAVVAKNSDEKERPPRTKSKLSLFKEVHQNTGANNKDPVSYTYRF